MYFKSEMLNFQQQCMDSSKDCHALKHLAVKMTIQSSSADIAFGLDDEQRALYTNGQVENLDCALLCDFTHAPLDETSCENIHRPKSGPFVRVSEET